MLGSATGNFPISIIVCILSRTKNIYGLGVKSEWFLRYKDFKKWFGLGMPPCQHLSLGFKTLLQNFILISSGSAHAPVNGGPVFPGTILGYFGLIKHFLAEFLLFSIILYITLAL